MVAARATRSLSARSRTLLVRFIGAASIGVVGGLLAALFLGSLNWATTTRTDLDWLVWLLPVGGLAVGLLYHHFGQPIAGGTSLVLDAAHVPDGEVPARLAPMIWSGSVASHLVGAIRAGTLPSGTLAASRTRLVPPAIGWPKWW